MKTVPAEILNAINLLLEPYGGLNAITPKNEIPVRKYLSVKEACDLLHCSRWTLIRAHASGKLPIIKMADARAGKILIESSALAKFINSKRRE